MSEYYTAIKNACFTSNPRYEGPLMWLLQNISCKIAYSVSFQFYKIKDAYEKIWNESYKMTSKVISR